MLMPLVKGLSIAEGYTDFISPEHPSKAALPTEVTDGGIMMEVSSVELAKAEWPIEVTEFGISS